MTSLSVGIQAGASRALVDELIAGLLEAPNRAAMIAFMKQAQRPIMSKALSKEIKAKIKTLGCHIEARHSREATATLLVLLFIDSSYVLPRLRREGVLRASRYGYRGSLIGTITKAALQIRPLMNASPEQIRYLESVIALSKLATDARALYEEIVKIIRSRRDRVLKTLLAILNNQFCSGWINDPSQSSLSLRYYTKEECAEGASLIFSIYASLFAITDECCDYVDIAAIMSEKIYEQLLLMAVRLAKYNDAETLINGLPYQATINGETITIASIDPDIERSVRLGYIQSENQLIIRTHKFYKSNKSEPPLSVSDIVDKGFESNFFDELIEIVDKPFRRYRIMLPTFPELFSIFSTDYMFRDERERLLFLDVNNFEKIGDVNEHVTTLDIFKLQRYFTFLSCVYQRKLERVEDEAERKYLTFTSTVFVISHDNLFMQMMLIFKSEAKVRSLIELLKMTISTKHIDLQYRPLIDLGSRYVIAPNLLAASNLARNTIVANGLRLTALGSDDLMVKEVTKALKLAGFKVEAGFELRVDGQNFELDIVAWRDGHLFLFECKNAYHPCSLHEMRNSYDHLKIGRDQLDKRRRTFSDPTHQKELYKKLGWAVEGTSNVHTGIVIANRVFHGATLNGHPVRQAYELISVLTLGRLVGEEHSLSIWAGSEFHASDLVTYLEGDSLVTKQLYALEPTNRELAMGYRRLAFISYALDLRTQHRIMEASYPIA